MSDKAAEMAKVSAKGGFNLFWGLILSTLISAVGVVILARVLSPQNYGLYTIALSQPSFDRYFSRFGNELSHDQVYCSVQCRTKAKTGTGDPFSWSDI